MIRVFIEKVQSDSVTLSEQRVSAEALLRRVLSEYYGEDAAKLTVAREANGKPYFPDAPQLHFNLSHAGEYVALAIGDEPVGIDIERIRPIRQAVAARFLNDGNLTDREAILAWTKRESYGKLTGEGFFAKSNCPHAFTEIPAPDGYIITVCHHPAGGGGSAAPTGDDGDRHTKPIGIPRG